ncbi:MAG: hypothetical protein K6E71_01470 [Lachnospiraceae bacterium]|nr:hypothetical protein [Lachnospiraceae bacterium]
MREHWSVIRLLIRRKMPKALLVLLLMLGVGFVGRYFWRPQLELEYRTGTSPFERNVLIYFLLFLFLLGLAGMVMACVSGPDKKSKTQYTFRRLQVSETSIFVWDMVINFFFFLVLWGCAVLVVALSAKYYMSMEGYREGTLGAVASIISDNRLFRGLVPVRNPLGAVHMILLVGCFGVTCSCLSYAVRDNRVLASGVCGALLGFLVVRVPVDTEDSWGGNNPLSSMVIWTLIAIALTTVYAVYTAKRIVRKEEA